jgi:hypothetical protein
MTEALRCPDCHGEMEAGYIPDTTYGGVAQAFWHPGDPKGKKTFLEAVASGGGVKYDERKTVPITTYRCSRCGMLKLYAMPLEKG